LLSCLDMYLKTGAAACRSCHILNLVPLKPWRHTRSCRRHLGAGSDELTLSGSSAVSEEGPRPCCSFLISLFGVTGEEHHPAFPDVNHLIMIVNYRKLTNNIIDLSNEPVAGEAQREAAVRHDDGVQLPDGLKRWLPCSGLHVSLIVPEP